MGENNMSYLIGCAVGILFGIMCKVLMAKFFTKDKSGKSKYDERQKIVRGRGYKYGFFTLLICMALDILLGTTLEMYIDRSVLIFTSLCLAVVVHAAYSIWNDGYFSINEEPTKIIIVLSVIGVINLWIGIRHIVHGTIIEEGIVGMNAMNLICGIMMLLILSVLAIKKQCSKCADER